jgi:hypothetical protein
MWLTTFVKFICRQGCSIALVQSSAHQLLFSAAEMAAMGFAIAETGWLLNVRFVPGDNHREGRTGPSRRFKNEQGSMGPPAVVKTRGLSGRLELAEGGA